MKKEKLCRFCVGDLLFHPEYKHWFICTKINTSERLCYVVLLKGNMKGTIMEGTLLDRFSCFGFGSLYEAELQKLG